MSKSSRICRWGAFGAIVGLLGAPALGAVREDVADQVPERVTFTRDVAPILHARCATCHRPGDIAPMALRTYDEVRPWAKSIRKAVAQGIMPPWHADPAYGEFANDRSLEPAERETIVRWVKQGAPEGEPADMPPLPALEEGWRLGEPDLEVVFDEVSLPADGPDVFEDLVQDLELSEDRWVKAIEILPGNREVVHHVIIYALEEGEGSPNGWLGGWAAGMSPMVFPEGTGRLLRQGSRLVADMHYHPSGEAATDRTRIGLHFHDGEPEKELVNLWIQNASFEIPPGAENYEVRSSYTFRQDSIVHALLPHMHYRGKDFTYTAVYPDRRREVLLRVPDYDFNWQTIYQLDEPLELPAGSRIECVAHYDNSSQNPANPDPTKTVTFGNESYDEMMIGFVDYTVKEGVRPASAEERLDAIREELVAEHPGEVFVIHLWEAEDSGEEKLETVLHLADGKDGGTWFIPVNGELWEAQLTELAGGGDGFTATLKAPFGTMQVEGTGAYGERKISGTVVFGPQKLVFEGALAGTI